MNLFFEHASECTPLTPCAACEVVAWLRSKLSDEDFASLVERVHDLEQAPAKRTYKRRKRNAESNQPDLPGTS